MAPIQTLGSHSTQSSVLNMAPTVCRCGGISQESLEWGLPIALRGNFFHDSFFKNVRTDFDAAVQDMLSKWGQMDMLSDAHHIATPPLLNHFSLYRQLRSRGNQEENHASTVVSDNRNHKIVIDVHDFMDGNMKVKVLGEKEVLVEGNKKTNSGDGSALSAKTFSRRFSFPSSVNMAEITSVMSSDGILTIEAPNLERKDNCASTQVKIETASSSSSSTPRDACASGASVDFSRCEDAKDTVYYCKGCNKKIGSWHKAPETKLAQQEGMKVPIQIGTSLTRQHQNIPVTHEAPFELRQNVQSRDIKINEQSQLENQHEKREAAVKMNSMERSNTAGMATTEIQTQSSMNKNAFELPVSTHFNFLPIQRRGPFFSDSFFQDMQKDFHSAVQEILSKWGTRSSFIDDDFSAYRNLRLCDLKEETQAVKSVEDDSSHKFVLDVQDFINGGEVTVKAINDREIVIEGHVERGEGTSKSLKRFSKRFHVPGDIKLDSVTSVMSSDGVLTITAPKKPSSVQLREVVIPVSLEGREEKNSSYIQAFENQNSQVSLSSQEAETSRLSNLALQANSNSSSNTNQCAMSNQGTSSKEHIIPINVEGGSSNEARTHNISHQVKSQKECNEGHSENTQQMMQNLHENSTKEHIIPINVEGTSNDSKMKNVNRQVKVETEWNKKQSEKAEQVMQKTQDNTTKDHIIPVSIEEISNDSEEHKTNCQGEKECKERHSENTQQQQMQKSQEKTNHQASSTREKTQFKSIDNTSDSAFKHNNIYQFAEQNRQASSKEENQLKSRVSNDGLTGISTKRYLPISRRGLFFDDTFFQSYQSNFQTAVRDVLIKSRQCVDQTDNMNAYRCLRQRDLKVENQALHVQEDQESLKIVVDAKDFVNGDITVCIDGEELVIEGRAENSESKSSTSLTFSHRFLLPEFADISTITSAISSDGILTVDSPKSGNPSEEALRRMSSEARSKHESHTDGGHKWEEKRVKESSEQAANGVSSRRFSSSYSSHQQQSSTF